MTCYRLGIPVKVVGAPLRAYDSRRWPQQPHLSVSLAYLRDLFGYLHQHNICLYRLAGQLAPYLTHPDLPHFHRQLEECATELAALGDLARHYHLRLTLHPAFYVQLNSPDPAQVARAQTELSAAAALLDSLGLGSEAIIVVHVGSAFGDPLAGRTRFVTAYDRLPPTVRARLAVENDDRTYDIADLHWIHKRTGVRLVLDVLHHRCHNPTRLPLMEALTLALSSWPPGEQAKIHFSSPRTELRRSVHRGELHLQLPLPNQHSDFIHPFEFIDFLQGAREAELPVFDIMLEAKAKELALVRLRQQLARYAPELAAVVG
jgi:UV DNA damage endonuclease